MWWTAIAIKSGFQFNLLRYTVVLVSDVEPDGADAAAAVGPILVELS
jgi:hypothetical protein